MDSQTALPESEAAGTRLLGFGCRLRASVVLEDGVAGDDSFELTGVGTIDNGDQRVIVHVAEGGIEGEIRVEAGQRLRGQNGA